MQTFGLRGAFTGETVATVPVDLVRKLRATDHPLPVSGTPRNPRLPRLLKGETAEAKAAHRPSPLGLKLTYRALSRHQNLKY